MLEGHVIRRIISCTHQASEIRPAEGSVSHNGVGVTLEHRSVAKYTEAQLLLMTDFKISSVAPRTDEDGDVDMSQPSQGDDGERLGYLK